jgi:Terminase large subunit, T4likevirus-type, N-terminal/Terminase RNaseH-like domain
MISNKNSYRDNPLLKRAGVQLNYTQEQVEEYMKCAKDPVYFATHYIKIVNVDRGLMPFEMWDFQKQMLRLFQQNRFVITKCPRQVGKTTTSVAYLLWLTLFTDSQNIAVLANKGSLARDILAKYQLAYENLPEWLQQGIITWNKGNVELENGSKIMASSTSSSAVRGGSFNAVFLDEFAFVPANIADEFFNSVYPVISSGKTTKIIIVSTPNGMNLFYKLWMDAINKKNGYQPFEIHWSMVPGRDEKWKEETIRNTSQEQFRQEFECEFLGSTNTLISGQKLQQLTYVDPVYEHDKMKIYEQPIKDDGDTVKDHLYAMTVDVSEGRNMDASAFSVFDISKMPYKQVAKYSSSSVSPLLFPTMIYNAARLYNDAYILIEINNTPQVAEILHSELEYENLWKVFTGNKKPQQLSAGFARGVQLGVKMSPQVKRIGCSNLKMLLEGDRLITNDFDTISELTTFVAEKNSFKAEEGANDDLVMTLVLFAWVTTQKYFKEIVSHDIRKQIQLESMNQIDDEALLEPIIEDGLENDFEVVGGDVWETANGGDTYGSWTRDMMRNL